MTTLSNLPAELNRERLVSTGQAAEFLGMSVVHFRRLYRTNKVPAPIRIGERKCAWKIGELIDFVSAKSQPEAALEANSSNNQQELDSKFADKSQGPYTDCANKNHQFEIEPPQITNPFSAALAIKNAAIFDDYTTRIKAESDIERKQDLLVGYHEALARTTAELLLLNEVGGRSDSIEEKGRKMIEMLTDGALDYYARCGLTEPNPVIPRTVAAIRDGFINRAKEIAAAAAPSGSRA